MTLEKGRQFILEGSCYRNTLSLGWTRAQALESDHQCDLEPENLAL